MPTPIAAAWRSYRVGKPGSLLPSALIPDGLNHDAYTWAASNPSGLLVVTGGLYTERRSAGFSAIGSAAEEPNWKGYWTAHDYAKNIDQLDNMFKLARVTNGNDEVLAEAYAYESAIHDREAQEWLFLDQLSEASLQTHRAFDLFNLISTRAASSRFRTVVAVDSLGAPVANHEASRAFSELFRDASTHIISV